MNNRGGSLPVQIATAQRIVAEQANCTLDEALALMQSTADATDETLTVIAEEVIRGWVRFD